MAASLRQLLNNPILKSNPGCLGGLLESVVQGHYREDGKVASTMNGASGVKPDDAPIYVRPAAPEPVELGSGETPSKTEEYTQFWKKFEVPRRGEASTCTKVVAAEPAGEAPVDKVNSPSAMDVASALARQNTIDFPATSSGSEGKQQVFAALPEQPPVVVEPVPGAEVSRAEATPPPSVPGGEVSRAEATPPPSGTGGRAEETPPPSGPGGEVGRADATPTPTSDGETGDGGGDDADEIDALRALKNAYMRFYRSIKSAWTH